MSDFDPGQLRAKLRTKRDAGTTGVNRGLRLGAEHLLGESLKVVPIEEGTLANTGTVSVDDSESVAAVSFSGPYAVIQHEDLTFNHDPGRHAKYLETPMNTERSAILALVAGAVRGEMGF